jgi:hypothetical protein
VTLVLKELGARATQVDDHLCWDRRWPSLDVTFLALEKTDRTENSAAAETSSEAHWQIVVLKGDCVFLHYITVHVLPLFATRNVKLIPDAVCGKTGMGLYTEVLLPTQQPTASPQP